MIDLSNTNLCLTLVCALCSMVKGSYVIIAITKISDAVKGKQTHEKIHVHIHIPM